MNIWTISDRIIGIILAIVIVFSSIFSYGTKTYAMTSAQNDRIIVSMGDSYSSGEGLGDYFDKGKSIEEKLSDENKDWLAHRSQNAWGGKLSLKDQDDKEIIMCENRDVNWYFVASSGAESSTLLSSEPM